MSGGNTASSGKMSSALVVAIPRTTVTGDGNVIGNGGANPATGYSVIAAKNLDDAIAKAKGCPILSSGGSVELAETFEP